MSMKLTKVVLASTLILSSLGLGGSSGHAVTQSNTPSTSTSTTTNTNTDTNTSTTGTDTNTDTSGTTDINEEETKPKGLSATTSETLGGEVKTTLLSIGGYGATPEKNFGATESKTDDVKLFNEIILTQLKMYQMLYTTGVSTKLELKAMPTPFAEADKISSLDNYIKSYALINKYLDDQVTKLKAEDEPKEDLIKVLESAKLSIDSITSTKANETSGATIEEIRTLLQSSINGATSLAIGEMFKYLNDGKASDDVTALKDSKNLEATKSLLNILIQWKDLPNIEGADDAMKLLDLNGKNQDWITALQGIIDTMSSDTGGTTDGAEATADNNTSPELATSSLGRLGSSLFTVARSMNADDDPDRPLTNTLGWSIVDELKKSDPTYDPGPAAKDDFLAMFAATSVYMPFVSKVGDRDYVEAYKALFNDTAEPLKDDDERLTFKANALGPLDILSQVQNLRKPLYFYNDLDALGENTVYGHSTEAVKGVAELLTVEDLLNSIKNKKDLAAITVNGVFAKDGDSWSFYNYSLNKDGLVETTASAPDPVSTPSEETDVASEEQVEAENTVVAGTPAPVGAVGTGAAGKPILNKVPAGKSINGAQENTRVVFEMSFSEKSAGVTKLTGALMHNIYHDSVLKSQFGPRMSEAVYIDIVGNLVLSDGLVILPAAANPTYWAMPTESTGAHDGRALFWNYNPFTVAFMETYPAIYSGGTAPASVNNKKDKNKYLLSTAGNDDRSMVYVKKIKDSYDSTYAMTQDLWLHRSFKLDGVGEKIEITKLLEGSINVDGKTNVDDTDWYRFGEGHPIQMKNLVTENGHSIFPYLTSKLIDPSKQESFQTVAQDYTSAILIAKNMYAYILGEVDSGNSNVTAASGTSEGGSSSGLLREGYLFNNVVMPVLTGSTGVTEFDKSNSKTDLLQAGGDTNIVEKWIINGANWLSTTSRSVTNLLSVAGPDDVSALKLLYHVFINYGFYIIFVMMVMLLALFLRDGDFMRGFLKASYIVAMLTFALFIAPLAVPYITKFTTEPLTKSTVLNSLLTNLESVTEINESKDAGTSGTSLKLYNFSPAQAKEINEDFNADPTNYLTNQFPVNNNVGLYVSGTELRLDLYSFWRFDPLIVATKEEVNDPVTDTPNIHQIYHSNHSKSPFVTENSSFEEEFTAGNEVLDYYMPYSLIEDGLIGTLNKYLVYYAPPRSLVRYPDGLVKSSYIMNSYMRSLAFLAAEPNIAELIAVSELEENYSHRGLTKPEVDLVNSKFYPYGDILGLQKWVDTDYADLDPVVANSLWTKTLNKAGYYDGNGAGIAKRTALANKVNQEAYDVIIRLQETDGLISDETMIKVVALYATMKFNETISFMNNTVYPQSIALEEFSVNDVLSATVLGDSRQYMFYDTSVVNNVYAERGIIGLAAVSIIILSLVAYSVVISFIVPVLVFGLILYSIYLIFSNSSVMPALIFAFRVLMIGVVSNIILVIIIVTYRYYENIYLLAAFLFVLMAIAIYVLYRTIFKPRRRSSYNWVGKTIGGVIGRRRGGDSEYPDTVNSWESLRESEGDYNERTRSSSSSKYR